MDLLALGAKAGIIIGIVVLSQVVKSFLPKKKIFKKLHLLLPLIFGFAGALATTKPMEWQALISNMIIYCGASSYIYKTGQTVFGIPVKKEE